MKATLHFADKDVIVDLSKGHDLSTRLDFYGDQPNAFGIPMAHSAPFRAGSFVGDTRLGGSVNCETFSVNPHGNGTHTECVGHIVDARLSVSEMVQKTFMRGHIVSVFPEPLGTSEETYPAPHRPEDIVVTRRSLEQALGNHHPGEALIIRTLPNTQAKRTQHFSGSNPTYLSFEAMQWIVDLQVQHLLVDFPSVDREEDGGILPNHHVFWGVEFGARHCDPVSMKTISEMIFVPEDLCDGPGVLNLQLPDVLLDAVPSRPRWFSF